MYCGSCGKEAENGAKFCVACGKPLSAEQNLDVEADPTKVSSKAPILESKVNLNFKKMGLAKPARALLYDDKVVVYDKRGRILIDRPISKISKVKLSLYCLTLDIDGQYVLFDFSSANRRVASSLFGGLGMLVGSLTDPGKNPAKLWKDTLLQMGAS